MNAMKIRRIVSVIISLTLVLAVLTSCGTTPEKLVEKAEKNLKKTPYVVEVDVDYHTTNSTVMGIFEQLERIETTVYFNDGDAKAITDLTIDDGEAVSRFYSEYVAVDGMLYFNMIYTSADAKKEIKNKAQANAESIDALINELLIAGEVSLDFFSDIRLEKRDGEHVVVCNGVSEDKRIELERSLLAQLESTPGSVKLNKAVMTLEIEKGKYDTVVFECEYDVLISGTFYPIGMTVELEFDYGERFKIDTPTDADSYTTVDIETII